MHTPSLRRRVTLSGVAVFILLVVLLDVFVYVTLRVRLEDTLDDVLAARVQLIRELDAVYDVDEVAERLGARGVPAVITTANGRRLDTHSLPRFETVLPTPPADATARRVATFVELQDGATAEVFASRGGVDAALRRVLVITLLGTAAAIVGSLLLFRRAADVAIAPLDEVVAAARRTAEGRSGERLDPDHPETELGRLATAYDAMLDALEDALADTRATEERTRRFLDDAAHQLRTPLATVRASVEALLREDDADVRDLLMGSLVRETARADRLLTALLTLARLDGGQPISMVPADLVALCEDEVERCRSLAPQLQVGLDAPDLPAVPADEDALREVVSNLLDNARRHAAHRIDVTVAHQTPETVEIRVRDDGPGIADADVERVFQRFASLDGRGGSGLGLAIGRVIAENHGGTLTYETDAFVLRLLLTADRREVHDRQS